MKKGLLIALALLVALALAGGAYWAGRWGGSKKDPNLLKLYGNVDIRQVELGFRVSGRLKSMSFEEGQSVTAGTELAALDTQPFEDEVRINQAQVAEADAAFEKAVHGSRYQEVAEASAAVREAAASAENASLTSERQKKLLADGAATQAAFDDAHAGARTAAARLASAKDRLDLTVAGSRSEDIAAAHAALDVSKARLIAAQTNLADAHLRAPTDGVILSRVREPGAIVSPVDTVYVLSLLRPVWVRAYVDEPQLGKLHPGMEVTLTSDSHPRDPVHGRIGFISPTAEFTPKSVETPELRTDLVYRLRIVVDEPGPDLRQGMPVTVAVPLQPVPRPGELGR